MRPDVDLISNCSYNNTRTVYFDDMVQFSDEEKLVNNMFFYCGMTFYPETPTNFGQINRERRNSSRSCAKPKYFSNIDHHNCLVDEEHTSNISLNPYKLWDVDPGNRMALNHIIDGKTVSNQYPQTTTQQPSTDLDPLFSPLRPMDSKRKALHVNFAFFQKNYLADGRMNKTVATVEELSDLWEPEAMDGVQAFVMTCCCN